MVNPQSNEQTPWTVFLIFLRLGLTSFGGPIAHLGYFRDEFVTRRQWLTERSYADLVGLCQFLPAVKLVSPLGFRARAILGRWLRGRASLYRQSQVRFLSSAPLPFKISMLQLLVFLTCSHALYSQYPTSQSI